MTRQKTRLSLRAIALMALGLAFLAAGACRREVPPVDPSTLEWPQLSLSQVDPELAQWLRSRQSELREQILANPTDTTKAAGIFGELGLVLDAWEQSEDAVLCYRNAALLDPSNPRWPHLEGLIHRDAGRGDEAVLLFEKVLKIAPTHPATRTYLAAIELDRGNVEVAAKGFGQVLQADPNDAAAHHGLGQIAFQQGRAAEAVEHFEKALELQPQATRVRYPLAQALREAGRPDEAAAALARAGRQQVAVTDPAQQILADVRAQTALRLVGEMAADHEGVTDLELLRFTLTQLSRSEGAIEALDRQLAALGPDTSAQTVARTLYAIAGLEIYAGREEAGLTRLARATELAPTMAEAWLKLGNGRARRGDFAGAEAAFTRAIEAEPDGEGLLARATVKLNRGDGDGALADLQALAARRPGDGVVRVRIAEAREVRGDLSGAFAQLQQTVADESLERPARARAARGLAEFLIRRSRHDQALIAYRTALELDPTSSSTRLALGEVLGHLGRWNEAAAELERVVVEQPSNEQARRAELIALVLQRDWEKARARLGEGLAQLPESAVLAELGARLLAACPDPAIRDPARALELAFVAWNSGESAKRADAVAIAWGASSRFADAIEWQDRAVRQGIDPQEAAPRLEAYRKGESWVARGPIELLGSPG